MVLLLVLVAGCVAPQANFASVAGNLPPVPPGAARIFFYRWLEPYESNAATMAYLNGRPAGVTEVGAVLYRDVAPAQYTIVVQSDGIFANQFKSVLLRPGDVAYVRIESLRTWDSCSQQKICGETFVVQIVDPAIARAEMQDLRFIGG
jgi:hypothetical protein